MPTYRFVAVGPDGAEIKDSLEAPSEDALRNNLLMRNLEVKSVKQKKKFNELELAPQRVPKQEIMHFSRQMAAFVRTGIPITEALEVVEDGSGNKRFRAILASMREQINNGVPFSDAIAEHARVFPSYYIGILKSAELTGQLDVSLEQLSQYMERELDSRSKIKAAMIYPAVIFGMSIMTVVILAVWVMPKFVTFFNNLQAKLPLPTLILIKGSEFAQKFWFVWAAMFVAAAGVLLWMHRSAKGRMVRDRMFLKVPLVKEVVLFAVTERVCRIVGAMTKAGVPLPETMNAAVQGANNKVFEKGLVTARDRMLEGEGLAGPIVDSHLFPRAAGQMMRVGEDTGTLDIQLENAADYYGRELEYKLKKLTSLFEPAVIIFMGLIVGFVAVALISAMYGVFNSSKTLNSGPKV
jgi:type IV pilus assembly protein PilC